MVIGHSLNLIWFCFAAVLRFPKSVGRARSLTHGMIGAR